MGQEVLHYSYPISHSGLDWGWIHMGLSLEIFQADVKSIYAKTTWLGLICIAIGLLVSYLFARKLSKPISTLNRITQRVAKGDLAARAEIATGDEVESLVDSFNRMTAALEKSQQELIAAREVAEASSLAKSQLLANMSHETQQLVGLMGGTLCVDSKPGKGSAFWFNTRFIRRKTTKKAGHAAPKEELPSRPDPVGPSAM